MQARLQPEHQRARYDRNPSAQQQCRPERQKHVSCQCNQQQKEHASDASLIEHSRSTLP
jgi:hypothetical protein